MNTSEKRPFGEEVKRFREQKRISQGQLAQAISVNRQTIVAWELGKNPPKDRTRVLELANALGLDNDDTNTLLAAAFLDLLPPWHVPYHRNPLFTGREDILQALHNALIPETTTSVSRSRAISGLGGIGKTQTALEYAYRYRNDYIAVLWLQADSHSILFSACVALAQELSLPEANEADQTRILASVRRWLKTKTKWLLILDNVEDFSIVEEFLPPGHRGCVLLTTRSQAVPQHIAFVHTLEVLSEEEGILLLLRRADLLKLDMSLAQAAPADCVQAKDLWELTEGLPLALDQIAAYVCATKCSLAHYRELYVNQQRRLDLLNLRGEIPPGHPESVATTFSLAFEKVQTLNPAAAELLQVCALLHPKAIPEEIITRGGYHLGSLLSSLAKDPLLFDQAIGSLQTYSLIYRDAQEDTLAIHWLVQAVLQDTMQAPEKQVRIEGIAAAINAIFRKDESWTLRERLLPHSLLCAKSTESWKTPSFDLMSLLSQTAVYLYRRGRYTEAEPLSRRALHIQEQVDSSHRENMVLMLNSLAEIYREQGKYTEAEPLYLRALDQALDHDRPYIVAVIPGIWMAFNGLAILYTQQGKYTEAELHYLVALEMTKQEQGSNYRIDILNNLAILYIYQGKYAEAELLCLQALHSNEQAKNLDHRSMIASLTNLVGLYLLQGMYRQAEPLILRALSVQEQTQGLNHPTTAHILNELAEVYRWQKKYTEAEQFYLQALHIREQTLGTDHPDRAFVLINLAILYFEQGKYEESAPLFLQALDIEKQVWGVDHPNVAFSLLGLANLRSAQGKYKEAEIFYKQALHLREQSLGQQNPLTANVIEDFARSRHAQGNILEAESLYQRALAIHEHSFGLHHPRTARTRMLYVTFLRATGRYDEATLLESSESEQVETEKKQESHEDREV